MKNIITATAIAAAISLGAAGAAHAQVYSTFNDRMFTPGAPATYAQTSTAGDIMTSTNVPSGSVLKISTTDTVQSVLGVSASTTTVTPVGKSITYLISAPYVNTNENRYRATDVLLTGQQGIPPAPLFEMQPDGKAKIGGLVTSSGVDHIKVSTLGGVWNLLADNYADLASDIKVGDYIVAEGALVQGQLSTMRIK